MNFFFNNTAIYFGDDCASNSSRIRIIKIINETEENRQISSDSFNEFSQNLTIKSGISFDVPFGFIFLDQFMQKVSFSNKM